MQLPREPLVEQKYTLYSKYSKLVSRMELSYSMTKGMQTSVQESHVCTQPGEVASSLVSCLYSSNKMCGSGWMMVGHVRSNVVDFLAIVSVCSLSANAASSRFFRAQCYRCSFNRWFRPFLFCPICTFIHWVQTLQFAFSHVNIIEVNVNVWTHGALYYVCACVCTLVCVHACVRTCAGYLHGSWVLCIVYESMWDPSWWSVGRFHPIYDSITL